MQKELYIQWQKAFAEWMLHKTDETASVELLARKRLLMNKSNRSSRVLTAA